MVEQVRDKSKLGPENDGGSNTGLAVASACGRLWKTGEETRNSYEIAYKVPAPKEK